MMLERIRSTKVRTTLTIDDDVLEAAREHAGFQQKNIGAVISAFARKGMLRVEQAPVFRNGIQLLPVQPGAGNSTPEMIRELLDELS